MKRTVSMFVSVLICGMMLMVGCTKQNLNLESFDNIIGCWTNPKYADNADGKSIIYYEKSNTLMSNSEGIKFLKNGTLIERKNASFCGTPPITYADYSGKWQVHNSDNIKIDVAYWGGMEHRIVKIINVTDSTLKIEILSWETQ